MLSVSNTRAPRARWSKFPLLSLVLVLFGVVVALYASAALASPVPGSPPISVLGGAPPPADTATDTSTPTSSPGTSTLTAGPTQTPTPTDRPGLLTRTPTRTLGTVSATRTPTITGTPTNTPTITSTPTITPTATATGTPCGVMAGTVISSANDINIYSIDLKKVSEVSSTDVWALGSGLGSSVLHWDGARWSGFASPHPNTYTTLFELTDIAALSSTDVWVVGYYDDFSEQLYPFVSHWNGSTWDEIYVQDWNVSLYGVSGVSGSGVWAVGDRYGQQPIIYHFYGLDRYTVSLPAVALGVLRDVDAVSANDVWAVGSQYTGPNQTLTMHLDGTAWSTIASPGTGTLEGISASSSSDAWAVGGNNVIHWNGTIWTQVPTPFAANRVAAISANDAWAVGDGRAMHWDGAHWTAVPVPLGLNDVDAVSGADVWGVGPGAAHWDGAQWTQSLASSTRFASNSLRAMDVVSANDAWAVGGYATLSGTTPVNRALIQHWDGTQWRIANQLSYMDPLYGVAALAADNVWIAGNLNASLQSHRRATTFHWNGFTWDLVFVPAVGSSDSYLGDISAKSANDIWTVGYYGPAGSEQPLIEHWNGTAWSIAFSSTVGAAGYLAGVDTISANDVWAVGRYKPTSAAPDQTLTMHWDGTAWTQVSSPSPGTGRNFLWSVSAVSSTDAWAAGYYDSAAGRQTLMMHWDGTAWTQVPSPNPGTGNSLWDVSAHSPDTVWAVGYYLNGSGVAQPLAMRWDGARWVIAASRAASQGSNYLYTVDAVAADLVLAAGSYQSNADNLTLAERYSAPTFSDVPASNPFYTYINALACRGIISGYSDATFRPNNLTTRGQLTKIVTLAQGWSVYTPPSPTFRDVPATDPFYQYIETAYSHNIISGYSCGTNCLEFRPGNNVTRGQLAKIVVLARGWPVYTAPTPTFQDVPTTDPFYEQIETAYSHGIISGYNCGTGCLEFRPVNNATRGQICKIVYLAITQP